MHLITVLLRYEMECGRPFEWDGPESRNMFFNGCEYFMGQQVTVMFQIVERVDQISKIPIEVTSSHPLEHSGVAGGNVVSNGIRKRTMSESLEKYTDPDAIRETSDNEPMGYSAHNGSPIEGSEPFNTDGTEDTEDGDVIMMGVVGSAAPWFLTGWTNDVEVEFMIDTGCQVTILATSVFEKMCKIHPQVKSGLILCTRRLVSADSSPLTVMGRINLNVAFPGLQCDMCYVVASIGSDNRMVNIKGIIGYSGLELFGVCVELYRKGNGMDAPGFASPIRAYRQNLCKMWTSNDPDGSETTNLCSLGVVDLDLTVCPDVFGLRAFDEKMPVTRMLPGASQCDLRLLIPDARIGQDGFHDVVIENLVGTSTWRSRHVSPSDVIGLHQRWPQVVFQVMRERCVELEDLRRKAYAGLPPAYRYTGRGYCPVCEIKTEHSLDSHMMCHHLDLGQLWRCPVEWFTFINGGASGRRNSDGRC